MKIRTDFVTNSSSSGFVCFHVENKELYDFLTELGIRFENTEAGVFTNKMIPFIILRVILRKKIRM